MTPAVNLIPLSIRRARAVAAHLRGWIIAGVVCAVVCTLATGVLFTRHTSRVARQASERRTLEAQRLQLESQAADAARNLADLNHRLSITQAMRGHPDWSALLRAIAARRDQGVTFENIDISPRTPPAPSAKSSKPVERSASAPPEYFLVRLRGVADSQPTLWTFVRSLESLRVFESVKTINSGARAVADKQVIEFSIECALSPQRVRASASAAEGSER
ncbi:MAG: PilN domain-containing protein [Phycisphaerales bacterium]|nr:PilN domain-containing protein [Phycisphaerales bacterium]